MKYSFMTFSTPDATLTEVLEIAGRYGYDGIEPRLDCSHAHGIEVSASAGQRAAIREQVAESGVALACLATSLTYADPEQRKEMFTHTRECIDLAADIGAPTIRVFGGAIPKGIPRERAVAMLVESLSAISTHAAERGVSLCLETHDDWCDPVHVAEVLRQVDHPNVGANWDVMHPVRTKKATIDESFQILKPWIRHLHIHDGGAGEGVTFAPIGQGQYDHRRVIELLKSINFEGFMSGEWIGWEPYDTHLPRELATLKRYERELA